MDKWTIKATKKTPEKTFIKGEYYFSRVYTNYSTLFIQLVDITDKQLIFKGFWGNIYKAPKSQFNTLTKNAELVKKDKFGHERTIITHLFTYGIDWLKSYLD